MGMPKRRSHPQLKPQRTTQTYVVGRVATQGFRQG
jgi:hypothetical protein